MLEQRRQQYLSLLGLDGYVPRRLLVGAAKPVLLRPDEISLPTEVDFSATSTVADKTISHGSMVSNNEPHLSVENQEKVGVFTSPLSALNALAELTEPRVVKTTVDRATASVLTATASENKENSINKEEPPLVRSTEGIKEKNTDIVAASVTASPSKELNFVLSVWRIRDQLLVIDSRQPGAAYPTDRLLQNILRAIGHPLAQLPASEIIRWPLFVNQKNNNKSVEQQQQDAEQACAMVQAYITAQMTKQPFKALLCMGDNAMRFSLNDDLNESGIKSDAESSEKNQWNIPVVTTPSLFSMLQEPLLKANAWSALQKIVAKKDPV